MARPKRRLLLLIATLLCLSRSGVAEDRQVQSLDGTWQILFDPENVGHAGNWHREEVFSASSDRRDIAVPSCWEQIEGDYEGVAFYRRKFKVPANWAGQAIRLQFDAVNYLTEVWLNGEVVGFHEGGFTPFEFRLDGLLRIGQENTLTLRVVGPILMQDKRIDGVGPLEAPQWRGGIVGGVWQSVRLVATGEVFVKDVFIVPRIADDSATFDLELENAGETSQSVQVAVTIRSAADLGHVVAQSHQTLLMRPGVNKSTRSLTIPAARYWSPEDPHLYRVEVRVLHEEEPSDTWSTRFGMREFTIRDKQFRLNGEPLFLKATFFEGLYPTRIAYPDSREMAAREIQLAKDAGFNMMRPWRRPPAPMWLDLADEMGILVVGSPALECMRLPLSTPYLPARVEHEICQTVLRDRNRACVVQWELFNEVHRPILKQMMRPMALATRQLDPTRLILDESGGWAAGARIYLPGQYEPMRFNDIHTYPGPLINRRLFDGFLAIGMTVEEKQARGLDARAPGRNVVPGLMSFVSELGYGSLPNLVDNNERFRRDGNPLTPAYRYHWRLEQGQKRVLKESGFEGLYPDLEKFCLDQQSIHGAANRRMIEAVRCNPDVAGYCIHALAAGDWILGAGLIDLWRNPKSCAYEATKAANQLRILVIRTSSRNVYAARGSRLEICGVNEVDARDATLAVEVIARDGTTVLGKAVDAKWNEGVSRLLNENIDTSDLRGRYTVKARASDKDGTVLAESAYGFSVFSEEDLAIPAVEIAVLDVNATFAQFMKKAGVDVKAFDGSTPRSTPVFVTGSKPAHVTKFTAEGGTAVYIQGVATRLKQGPSARLPFTARVEPARGLWTCIPHLVGDHPIFAGLPNRCMMREAYENVWATQTLRDLPGKPIVASIGFEWFSRDHKLQYSGPGESWWGSDLAVVPQGNGRAIVSQLRIVENLGKDPVADKILYNLIKFAAGR